MNGQAICKDCGNGTLNNAINEQFILDSDDDGNEFVKCVRCGSTHIDGELYFEQDETMTPDQVEMESQYEANLEKKLRAEGVI